MSSSPARIVHALLLLALSLPTGSTVLHAQSAPDAQASAAPSPPVVVHYDPNVETMGFLLAIAFDDYGFGDFSLPVVDRAQAQFAGHRGHPAVAATREMVQALGIDGYASLALHAAPFGSEQAGALQAPLPEAWLAGVAEGDPAAGRARVDAYLQHVADFYDEAEVGAFLDAHREAYAQAEREVGLLVPEPDVVAAMERYFGERLSAYTIVPTLTHPPGGNVGVSIPCADAPTGAGGRSCRAAFFMMGAQIPVSEEDLVAGRAAGFDAAEHREKARRAVTDLALHEFGHAFINRHLEQPDVRAEVDRHAHLMERVRDRMAPQAYRQWFAVATEHLVRTTEVRVALSAGDTARAERLRRQYVEDRAFVYLPWLEEAARRYEQQGPNGTGRYPTFGPFVPEMVRAFADVDPQAADAALGIGAGPPRRVTVRVAGAVPAGDTVYVTGSHRSLGDWDPRAKPLRLADGTWTRTFDVEEGTRLEFKVTRGSWATEAADEAGRPRANSTIIVRRDTTVTVHVEHWADRGGL